MKYLRLFSVVFLLSVSITGCHRRSQQAIPPPQAEPPIISTLPPMPPFALQSVELGKPEPVAPAPPPSEPVIAPKKHTRARHHRVTHKPESTPPSTTPAPSITSTASTPAVGASPIGQLSADDASSNPKESEQTHQLIQSTEKRLKNLSGAQQAAHKDAIAQVQSFLNQAKQALSMNDFVGAQTLANKAKILLDELLK